MAEPFATPPVSEKPSSPFLGLAIGLALVIVVIGYLVYSSRTSPQRQHSVIQVNPPATTVDAYAANLKLTDVHMSTADNIAGGTMIYIEGNLTNTGAKTVSGATIEVTFKNALGQVVQRESQSVLVFLAHEPADDLAALNQAPLAPGKQREFRLTFERISLDWNQQQPELRVVTVNTQ